MAHSRPIYPGQHRSSLGQVAPLASVAGDRSRRYQSAVYHVNTRVLLTRLSTLSTVHRSVPAVDDSALSRRDQYSVVGTWSGSSAPCPPASSLVPSEYAARFMMRQSARPTVVGLDGKTILPERITQRPDKAFLPSVSRSKSRSSSQQDNVSVSGSAAGRKTPKKKRSAADSGRRKSPQNERRQEPICVHGVQKAVAPPSEQTAPPAGDLVGDPGFRSRSRHSERDGPALLGTTSAPKLDDYLLEPAHDRRQGGVDARSVGYISNNTRMTPRENPWVYRYKVKKNMNQINKLLTSKSPGAE